MDLAFYGREAEKYCCIFVVHPGFNSTQESRTRTYPLLIILTCFGIRRNLHVKSVLLITWCVLNVEVCSERRRNESFPSSIGTCICWKCQCNGTHKLSFCECFERLFYFLRASLLLQFKRGDILVIWMAWLGLTRPESRIFLGGELTFSMVVIHHFGCVTQSFSLCHFLWTTRLNFLFFFFPRSVFRNRITSSSWSPC